MIEEIFRNKCIGGTYMKYSKALYITVVLFIIMGISAMASPENMIKTFNDATTNLISSVSKTLQFDSSTSNLNGAQIPEFPALIIPVASIIGLMFLFQHKKTQGKK
jgi:hypothetical protein